MFSKTIIVGNLTRDPEGQYTPSGKFVCKMGVAVNVGWGENKHTQWWNVEAWEKKGEVCNNYLKSGSKVLVEGTIKGDKDTGKPRMWERTDGTKDCAFEITANEVTFLSSKE